MNVLSLFDGISCGQVALERANIPYTNYYASEIDKHAIKVTQNNYPKTIQLGSVTDVKGVDLPKIDLLIGGSPCQGFSFAGKQLNFDDPRSKLFFEYVRLKNELNPEWFLLENVRMKREYQDIISEAMGCEPVFIDSKDFSAQTRKRLYWTNIPVDAWGTDDSVLTDVIEANVDAKYYVSQERNLAYLGEGNQLSSGYKSQANTIHDADKKAPALCAFTHGYAYGYVKRETFRRLTPVEFERLQTLPDGYTSGVADTAKYKGVGNGWTVDVIAHIFRGL